MDCIVLILKCDTCGSIDKPIKGQPYRRREDNTLACPYAGKFGACPGSMYQIGREEYVF